MTAVHAEIGLAVAYALFLALAATGIAARARQGARLARVLRAWPHAAAAEFPGTLSGVLLSVAVAVLLVALMRHHGRADFAGVGLALGACVAAAMRIFRRP